MILEYIHRADTINIIAAAIMFVLQVGDWYTTKQFLKYGGSEGNPIGEVLIRALGINGAGIVKVLIATPFLIYANVIWISIAMNTLMLYVVISNCKYMKKLKERLKARLNIQAP